MVKHVDYAQPLMKRLENKPNISKLSRVWRGYLQVLLPEFSLIKEKEGRRLEVAVTEEHFAITDGRGKHDFAQALDEEAGNARILIERELTSFAADPKLQGYRFDASACPFRYANGGVLPIIRIDSEDYFCLIYRDIFPIGWNIANGASDSLDELLDPGRVALREFGEELIIFDESDEQHPVIYTFDPGEENRLPGYQDEAIEAWSRIRPQLQREKCTLRPMPFKWIEGPDQVSVTLQDRHRVTGGYFLNITPQDNAIEVDRFALINLKGNIGILDGEILLGELYNRLIGLFKVATFDRRSETRNFVPDRYFHSGKVGELKDFGPALEKSIMAVGELRSTAQLAEYQDHQHKLDLCPITRAVIGRYFEWGRAGDLAPKSPQLRGAERCQIFISHRSVNAALAYRLFQFLSGQDYQVFFSPESLAHMGESNYAAFINKALDQAECLVVLATNAEDFQSGWVDYEWTSFLNEINGGRKKKGQLFTFVHNVSVNELPYALRSRQMISFNSAAPEPGFDQLARFINEGFRRTGLQ